MKAVRFHPKASEELEAAAAREVRDSIRRRSIHRFPYFLYYSAEESDIAVIAVAHKRRRPEFWEKRLKAT